MPTEKLDEVPSAAAELDDQPRASAGSAGEANGHARQRRQRRGRYALWLAATFVLLTVVETGVYLFVRSKGVQITGDEPHYLILALALTHLNPHVVWAYQHDLQTHAIYPYWAKGATVHSPGVMHSFSGPHGIVSAHAIGLSVLIMPFMAIGGKHLALVGYFAIEAAAFIYLHQRGSWLLRLSRGGKVVFALALAGPAVWIAATQLYPDPIAGILVACALVEVAVVERRRSLSVLSACVFAGVIGFLPWLHVKNFLPAGFACLAFAVAAGRARAWKPLFVVGGVVALSWGLEFAYDLYYFGHLLGLPQPTPTLTKAGLTQTMALVFGRQQGLLVQVPTVVIGLVGMWLARRRTPATVLAALLGAGSILLLNGSYTSDPFGGTDLAGRFEWTTVPMLLLFVPWVVARLQRFPARLRAVGVVIAGLWVAQAVPILAGHHLYYNVFNPTAPWDPSLYTGWWWPLDHVLPGFGQTGRVLGSPWYGLVIEVAAALIAMLVLLRLLQPRPIAPRAAAVGTAVGAGGVIALAVAVPTSLPATTLSWGSPAIGGTLASQGTTPATGPDVPLQGVGPGRFRATLHYVLQGSPASGTFTVSCGGTGPANRPTAVQHHLVPGRHVLATSIDCSGGAVAMQLHVGPSSKVDPLAVSLQKTAD